MLNAILVKESQGFADGKRLLEELDKRSFPVVAALWRKLPEYDDERLVIVTPEADNGNLRAYMSIQEVLRALPDTVLRLSDILALGAHSRRFQELRREVEGVLQFVPPEKRPSLEGYASDNTAIYRWPAR